MPAFLGIPPLFWYMVAGAVLLVIGMTIGILLAGLGRTAAKPPPITDAEAAELSRIYEKSMGTPAVPSDTPPPPDWLIEVQAASEKGHPLDPTMQWYPPKDV